MNSVACVLPARCGCNVFSFRITDLKTQHPPPKKKKLPHDKIYKAKEIKFVSVNKLWKTCKSFFINLLSGQTLQQEEKELGLVLSSVFIFILGGIYNIGRIDSSRKDFWPVWGGRWFCSDSAGLDEGWNQGAVPAQAPPALHRKCFTGVNSSNCSGNNHILLLEVPPSFTLAVSLGCSCVGMTGQDTPDLPPGGEIELIPAKPLVQKGHLAAQSTQISSSSLPVISVWWNDFISSLEGVRISGDALNGLQLMEDRTLMEGKAQRTAVQVFILYLEYSFCTHFHLMWDFLKPSSGAGYFHSESCKLAWGNSAWFTFFNLEKK